MVLLNVFYRIVQLYTYTHARTNTHTLTHTHRPIFPVKIKIIHLKLHKYEFHYDLRKFFSAAEL